MDGWKSLDHHPLLVLVHDLNVIRIATLPSETDPPLIVDPDAGSGPAGRLFSWPDLGGEVRKTLRAAG
jgi:hypothetical protein